MIKGYTVGKNEYTKEQYLTVLLKEGEPITIEGSQLDKIRESINNIFEFAKTVKSPEEQEKDKLIDIINDKTTDEEKLEIVEIYPTWESLIGKRAEIGDILNYQGTLYKVRQAHTYQSDWLPNIEEALYIKIGFKDESTGLEEIIPDNLNPYKKGFIGYYQGHVYESNYDNNANIPYTGSTLPDWWTDLGLIEEYQGA